MNGPIKTTSIPYAAYLHLAGLQLVSVTMSGRDRVAFEFRGDTEELEMKTLTEWNNGSVLIPARAYSIALNRVKSTMYRLLDSQQN